MNTSMNRIYVANLPPDIRIKDIDDFFRPFGRVVNIDVNNRSNPVYAYVQFDTARNAYNAVRARHGYDYEGYTLQMRLVESEVIKRREFTPPPPPPPIFNNERQNSGLNNFGTNYNRMPGNLSGSSFPVNLNSQWTNNNTSMAQQSHVLAQYTTSNRNNMPQQNMNFPTNIRQQDMRMRLDNGRSNVLDQFSNTNNQNMQQQFPNSNFSNMQQQYTNSNRSNMPQQNNNFPNHSDMLQQNTMPYSGNDRSSMQDQYNYNNNVQEQMGMMNNSNNSSWNSNINMNRNFGNQGMDQNIYNNARRNESYNSNDNFDMYTNGVSGPSRNSHNQYMQKGSKPENARTNALEHRNAPYHREATKNKPVPVDNANAALETIGNTIMSLLSTNQLDNFQQGSRNFGRSGPSTSLSQTPRNVVSKQQYLKSIAFLRQLKSKRNLTSKDEVSRKYHTQIVKDFEKFTRESRKLEGEIRSEKPRILSSSGEKFILLEDQLRKKKGQLLKAAKALNMGKEGAKRLGGAYKKRINILMHEAGFSDIEAKALAAHPLEKLKDLIALKQEYDVVNKKTDFIPTDQQSLDRSPKIVVYRNDMKYLKSYQELKISKLSSRIITALNDCVIRIHKYEREQKLPFTGGKFVSLLQKIAKKTQVQSGKDSQSRRNVTATGRNVSATARTVTATTKNVTATPRNVTATTTANKKKVEKNDNEKATAKTVANSKEKINANLKNKNVAVTKQDKTATKGKEDKTATKGKEDKNVTEGNKKIDVNDGAEAKTQEKKDEDPTEDNNTE